MSLASSLFSRASGSGGGHDMGGAVEAGASVRSKRKAERRAGVHDLVREMAADWTDHSGSGDLRSVFVSRIRRLVGASNVQFAELAGTSAIRVGRPVRTRNYVAYAVPGGERSGRTVLEASFEGREPDEWGCQILEAAANL